MKQTAPAGGEPAPGNGRFEGKRQQILDVATQLLNERGVRGMTFQDIAQALSLKTTSVVYYYRYKELLASAVFEDTLARLAAMVRTAAAEPTPEQRVTRYVELYFEQTARALIGEVRPLAILSEIRTLDDDRRQPLIAEYQALFRSVRALFGDDSDPARRWALTARAQMLNEALFWSMAWLPHYSIRDFPNVRRRLLQILRHGLAVSPGQVSLPAAPEPDAASLPLGRLSLLRSATRLINQFGYKGASVDRIMSELQLSKGTFYHHIDAKDDLVLQCLRESHNRLAAIQAAVDEAGGSGWERLARGIGSVLAVQFGSEYPLLRTTALQAIPAPVREVAMDLMGREALWLAGMLTDAMQEGSVRVVDPAIGGHLIMSSINSAYDIRGWSAKRPLGEAVATYAGLLWSGIFD